MKIRTGLVSNSSSSSFLAIVPADMDPFEDAGEYKKVLEYCFPHSNEVVLGQKAKVYTCYYSNEDDCFELEDAPEDALEEAGFADMEDHWSAQDKIYQQATKLLYNNKEVFFQEDLR